MIRFRKKKKVPNLSKRITMLRYGMKHPPGTFEAHEEIEKYIEVWLQNAFRCEENWILVQVSMYPETETQPNRAYVWFRRI